VPRCSTVRPSIHRATLVGATLLGACYDGALGRDDSITGDGTGDSTGAAESIGDPSLGSDGGGVDESSGAAADESSSGGEPVGACAPDDLPTTSALQFDGVDDHVTMGLAPQLGLATFTLEAWVRRDAEGDEAGTGVGGVHVVPILAKGRGENDDTIYNCNYILGFQGGVIAADFEDTNGGTNHPVVGTIAIPWDEWHHVAASYDGTTWRLYVDGVLDVQMEANATPRADSIQHFALGTSMDSMGMPQGRFAGALDEVRVWNRARTDAEIAESASKTVIAGEGLVARWALEEADAGVPDSVGQTPGTLAGPTFTPLGAVLDRGEAPTVVAVAPADENPLPADAVELEIVVADPDEDEFVATFHLREVSDADDFTIVVLPDTQYYSDPDSGHNGTAQFFHDQTQWIRDNREAYNIVGVIHNGDIVNHGARQEEWTIATAAMERLEVPEPVLPEGVPYGVTIGNHDCDAFEQTDETTKFNEHFGVARFAGRPYYGGHYGADNDENWVTFWAGGLQFVVVNLQWDETPSPAVLAWARSVFDAHPDAFGILNSHYLLDNQGEFGPQGQAIYDALAATPNVHLMTCGHVSNEHRRTDVFQGHPIHTMLADYQGDPEGGSGYLRIWEFSPANDELTVRTYSPAKDMWLSEDKSEFTLEVEMPGAGGPFSDVAVVDPAASGVKTLMQGLAPGRTYEWYATVSDCAHTVSTPVQRFVTQP
jgi:hypothetical protein